MLITLREINSRWECGFASGRGYRQVPGDAVVWIKGNTDLTSLSIYRVRALLILKSCVERMFGSFWKDCESKNSMKPQI